MKLFYDLHIHSALSPCGDADMTPNNIVNMAKIKELLSTPDLKQRWQKKRETMLSEMIDVTDFMVNLAEDIYAGLR